VYINATGCLNIIHTKYSSENLRRRNHLEDMATNRRTLLKLTLEIGCEVVAWIQLVMIGFRSEEHGIILT
jgi:hypothetical protein